MNAKAYLGIDVSKGYADFLLLDQNKHVLEEVFHNWTTTNQVEKNSLN